MVNLDQSVVNFAQAMAESPAEAEFVAGAQATLEVFRDAAQDCDDEGQLTANLVIVMQGMLEVLIKRAEAVLGQIQPKETN